MIKCVKIKTGFSCGFAFIETDEKFLPPPTRFITIGDEHIFYQWEYFAKTHKGDGDFIGIKGYSIEEFAKSYYECVEDEVEELRKALDAKMAQREITIKKLDAILPAPRVEPLRVFRGKKTNAKNER